MFWDGCGTPVVRSSHLLYFGLYLGARWKKAGFLERKNSNDELIKVSYEFVKDARKWNVMKAVKNIRAPILIVLGKKDETVLSSTTRKVFRATNEPKRLIEIEDMPHDYKEQPRFMEEINKISGDFMQNI